MKIVKNRVMTTLSSVLEHQIINSLPSCCCSSLTLYPHAVAALVYQIAFPSDSDDLNHMDIELAASREDLFAELKEKEGFELSYNLEEQRSFNTIEDALSESEVVALVSLQSEDYFNAYASSYLVTHKNLHADRDVPESVMTDYLSLPPA